MEPLITTTTPLSRMGAPLPDHKATTSTSTLEITTISDSPTFNAAHTLRLQCRANTFISPTSGLAPGHIQANLLILPLSAAPSFFALCQRNPVPCPLLAYCKLGNPHEFVSCLPGITGEEIVGDFDVRTDAPSYHLYENGKNIGEVPDVVDYFREDHVAFLIECSFSFKSGLTSSGLPPRHILPQTPEKCRCTRQTSLS